jgi:phage tail sheath protein FI
MPTFVSPGVYVREVDLSTVIPAASTSIGAFVGSFNWGPVEQPTLVSSESKLSEWFGKPTVDTTATDFLTAASFLSYSGALKVVRVVSVDGEVPAANAAVGGGLSGEDMVKNETQIEDGLPLDTKPAFFAKYPGKLGNSLKVVVLDEDMWDAIEAERAAAKADGEKYPSPELTPEEYQLAVDKFSAYMSFDSAPVSANNELHVVIIDSDGAFSGTPGNILEKYGYVQTTPGAKKADGSNNYIQDVITKGSSYVNVGAVDDIAAGVSPLIEGADGGACSANEYVLGWDLFNNQEEQEDISLLICPSIDTDTDATVSKHVIDIAISRTDCVAFVSPPRASVVGVSPSAQLGNIVGWRKDYLSVDTSYAVMDSGWKYVFNKYLDRYEWIPLCGDIAGLCARTDTTNDPWFSPAGYNRGNIKNCIKLAFNPDKASRDELYSSGVNPVVNFRGTGPILFGDKTLQTRPSAFDRINVRRLFIVLERVISKASKYQLFEFNDQFTRAQFVNIVEPFLRDVQARRGIYDYKVVADETNNTPQVIDSNTFVGDIYIKPARSINFIQLSFVAVRTGVNFTEVVGKF